MQLGTRRHFKKSQNCPKLFGQRSSITNLLGKDYSELSCTTILQVMYLGTPLPTFFFSNTFNFHLGQKKICHNNERNNKTCGTQGTFDQQHLLKASLLIHSLTLQCGLTHPDSHLWCNAQENSVPLETEPKCSLGEGRHRKGEGHGVRGQTAGSHHHSTTTEHLFIEGALPTQWTQTFPKPFAQ